MKHHNKTAIAQTCLLSSLLFCFCVTPVVSQVTQADFARESQQADKFMAEEHMDIAKKILKKLTQMPYARDHEFYQLAFCYIKSFASKEDYVIADRYAQHAILLNPESGHAYLARAMCAIELYDNDSCIKFATRALSCKQPDPYGHYIRARAYIQIKKYNQALADVEAWNNTISKVSKKHVSHQIEAEIYEKLGNMDKAVEYYRLERDVHPELALKNSVRCLRKQKKYAEAISEASLLIKRNTDDSDAYNLRASIKAESKDWKGAITDYSRAISTSPTPTYYRNRAAAYKALGQSTLAKQDFVNADK